MTTTEDPGTEDFGTEQQEDLGTAERNGLDRSDFLKIGVAAGGLALFGASFAPTVGKAVQGAGEAIHNRGADASISGTALEPEYTVSASGELVPNPHQRVSYTMCMGCTTFCGVRVRVDVESGKVVRAIGNPYHPLSADPAIPQETSIRDSFLAVSGHEEAGLSNRSTVCGRGASMVEHMSSPFRITQPLKRVGPRGGGQWKSIPFEQLVDEVVEGGDLFGEGHVDGLRAICSDDLINPVKPDLGPKANQFALLNATNEGRENFLKRFVQLAFGSINMTGHGSFCGGSYRSGSGAVFGDLKTMPHAKPDIANAEFIIFWGTSPANAGNPFKRQGGQLAAARTTGDLHYVVVDPAIGQSDAKAAQDRGKWIPIRPATDGALAMAMIAWIIENSRYDATFLSQPGPKAAEAAGEVAVSNATHLVRWEPGNPRHGTFLRASEAGLPYQGDPLGDDDPHVVVDPATGALLPSTTAPGSAELLVDMSVALAAEEDPVPVRSAFSLLRESAQAMTLEQYSEICGVPVDTIVGLAKEFTSHGKRAAVNSHGGTMAANGFYSAYAIVTLNTLIGNLGVKGGTMATGGSFASDGAPGPRYDLTTFPVARKPTGTPLSRHVAYEKSTEFAAKKAAGHPYPAKQPWYPAAPALATEWLGSALAGYPYPLKALFVVGANPVYGIPGIRGLVEEALKDPKALGLIVAIDPFINETGAFADYLMPDTVMYETWGFAAPWHGVPTKVATARWPVVEPPLAKDAVGDPYSLETFLIAVAKAMDLPGFGADAIPRTDGSFVALDRPTDWYLRGAANIAFGGKKPVPDATADDLALTGVDRFVPLMKATLAEDEWPKAAHIFSRGGRFQPVDQTYEGDLFTNRQMTSLSVYNEQLALAHSAITGKRNNGSPGWHAPGFADGSAMRDTYLEAQWPMLLSSQKSVLQSSITIGLDRLRGLRPTNLVAIHVDDADRLGIHTGDEVRLTTPGGSATGVALVRRGVVPGCVMIEHGFGHRELGARSHTIDGVAQPERPELGAGINLNDLGVPDPSRGGPAAVWVDPVCGSAVRQGIPARVELAKSSRSSR